MTPDFIHHSSTEASPKSVLFEALKAELGTPHAVPAPDFTWNHPERELPGW
jgi:hypothetical protein